MSSHSHSSRSSSASAGSSISSSGSSRSNRGSSLENVISTLVERLVPTQQGRNRSATTSTTSQPTLQTLALQRLLPVAATSIPTALHVSYIRRVCTALQYNSTVTSLEIWLPSTVDDDDGHQNASTVEDSNHVDCSFLTDMLAHNCTVTSLTVMAPSLLGRDATRAIVAGLEQNVGIVDLKWQGGSIPTSSKGSIALWAPWLATTTRLQSLTLSYCTSSYSSSGSSGNRSSAEATTDSEPSGAVTSSDDSNHQDANAIESATTVSVSTCFWHALRGNRSIVELTLHQPSSSSSLSPSPSNSDSMVANVWTALDNNPVLQRLSLTQCNLSTIDTTIVAFPRLPALQELRLAACQLTLNVLESIHRAAATTTCSTAPSQLKRLDLRGNAILATELACRILHAILNDNNAHNMVQHLVLEGCQLTDDGLDILLEPSSNTLCRLVSLSLRDNALTTCRAFQRPGLLPGLVELDLSDNPLGSGSTDGSTERQSGGGMTAITSWIRQQSDSSLQRLILESCAWTAADISDLCAALLPHVQLTHLNLNYNPSVGSVVSSHIAPLLSARGGALRHLHSLQLGSCSVTDEGLAAILNQLGGNDAKDHDMNDTIPPQCHHLLHTLSLPWNNITQAGVQQPLVPWIRRNYCNVSLRSIQLQFNSFDVASVLDDLADCVQDNYWLCELKLSPLYGVAATKTRAAHDRLSHGLRMNRAGRHYAVRHSEQVPHSQWPDILAHADRTFGLTLPPDALYFMLREATPHWLGSGV